MWGDEGLEFDIGYFQFVARECGGVCRVVLQCMCWDADEGGVVRPWRDDRFGIYESDMFARAIGPLVERGFVRDEPGRYVIERFGEVVRDARR